jgi:hypothetical protein
MPLLLNIGLCFYAFQVTPSLSLIIHPHDDRSGEMFVFLQILAVVV